ncbi:hypothetical protein VTO42DRAFT_2907 [Malbranchea cinnamomea]
MAGPRGRGNRNRSPARGTTPLESGNAVNNPSLPPVRTSQFFSHGANPTPNLPPPLEALPELGTSEMAGNIALSTQHNVHERDFQRIIDEAQSSPNRGRVTRSVQRAFNAAQEPHVANVRNRRSPSQQPRLRQKTPDQEQLDNDLRRASEEAEELSRPQQQPPEPPSSVLEDSTSRSWFTERNVLPQQQPRQTKPLPTSHKGTMGADGNFSRKRQTSIPLPFSSNSSTDQSSVPPSNLAAVSRLARGFAENIPILRPTTSSTANIQALPTKRDLPSAESSSGQKRKMVPASVLTVIFAVLALFCAVFAFRHTLGGIFPFSKLPFAHCGDCQSPSGYVVNSTAYEHAINGLSTEMDQKLVDMANEVASIREELERKMAESAHTNPLVPWKINFLAPGSGAVIIPHLTTPTKAPKQRRNGWGRFAKRLVGIYDSPLPPIAALQPWDDPGQCWCAPAPESQLAVHLGYPIVPEEVIVEHIHRDATVDPGLAPREMELWAAYSPVMLDNPNWMPPEVSLPPSLSAEHASSTASPSPSTSSRRRFRPPAISPSARLYLLDTLRMAFPGEPDSAFSDHPNLGPEFFRLGKWEYDVYSNESNIQRFRLHSTAELPGYRVTAVIVKTNSNWGGSHTCLYRVRLHGRL